MVIIGAGSGHAFRVMALIKNKWCGATNIA
jgi:hypothetical protein